MAIRFPFAEQPDIIRASQKDEFYQRVLNQQAYEVTIQSLGPRTASKFKDEFSLLSDLFYFGVSTLLGRSESIYLF
jgi:peroxin-10